MRSDQRTSRGKRHEVAPLVKFPSAADTCSQLETDTVVGFPPGAAVRGTDDVSMGSRAEWIAALSRNCSASSQGNSKQYQKLCITGSPFSGTRMKQAEKFHDDREKVLDLAKDTKEIAHLSIQGDITFIKLNLVSDERITCH
ncbi:hypothetical protein HPG69_016305 [Diceros bicornis minor]|uniref:Uncharacterized protein n=1 Tax=Diceros bicornis minor TaxID=77932 RepID=A0A7J7F795_DICBM|nr:hypothetical protein HPG69_016305 [Diceros bicornis minor]